MLALLRQMHAVLRPHGQGEENGIFEVMAARDQQNADYVGPLIAEHRELARLLASVDVTTADGEQAVRVAFDELRGHIRREEDGLFPGQLDRAGRQRLGRGHERLAGSAPRRRPDQQLRIGHAAQHRCENVTVSRNRALAARTVAR
jgi:hypothetical protein